MFDVFEKIVSGICFLPLAKRFLDIVKSNGFEPHPRRPVCLSNVNVIPHNFWLRNVVKRDKMSQCSGKENE